MNDSTRNEDILQYDRCPKDLREVLLEKAVNMQRRPISRWERLLMACLGAICVCGVAVCAVLLLKEGFAKTKHQCFALLVTLLFSAASAYWVWSVLKRGYYRALQAEMPYAVWIFCAAIIASEIFTKQDERTLLTSIVGIVLIGFAMTWDRIKASELRVREGALRIALEFCDNREKQLSDKGDGGSAWVRPECRNKE
jgi:hypothetical protein